MRGYGKERLQWQRAGSIPHGILGRHDNGRKTEKQERQQMEETGHGSRRIRGFIITLDGLVWGMVINAVVFRHSHSWKSWTDRGMNRRRDRWTDSVLLSVPRSTSDAHITAV